MNDNDLREQVRERYAASALAVTSRPAPLNVVEADGCCGPSGSSGCCGAGGVGVGEGFGAQLYDTEERDALPTEAVLASLGCGNPLAVAELRDGETVLDLGSGGGIDVLLSAKRVGAAGKAYGLDMTEEMLALALDNATKAGATNVEFLKGTIEQVPLPAGTVDVVISNCVVNLSIDKLAVFAEIKRVLRPGGRVGITDVVAGDHIAPSERAGRGSYVGCVAGALSVSEYRAGLAQAGLVDIVVEPTHQVADGMHSAIIRATKPPASGGSSVTERTSGIRSSAYADAARDSNNGEGDRAARR
ncbi:arsenite methyltransferase [Phytoactinopolyspora endophytica]|uniref:arsenite methyltransferase n=1 Tax=Phytoactinopolyspora endophytica TaxID=1642495 RepID=UPI00101D3061|nr:arsenite methyltransferase [Phytoactinopolyspora endophytica]